MQIGIITAKGYFLMPAFRPQKCKILGKWYIFANNSSQMPKSLGVKHINRTKVIRSVRTGWTLWGLILRRLTTSGMTFWLPLRKAMNVHLLPFPLLVQWVDYRYSKEGATLANYGTEGNTFEYDTDGNPCFTDMITANPEGMTSSLAMNVFTLWRCECLYDAYRMNSTFTDDQKDAPAIWSTNSDSECTMPSVTLTAEEAEQIERGCSKMRRILLQPLC